MNKMKAKNLYQAKSSGIVDDTWRQKRNVKPDDHNMTNRPIKINVW